MNAARIGSLDLGGPTDVDTMTPANPSCSTRDDKRREGSGDAKGKGRAETAPSAPYTQEERARLKRDWGGEFKFLTTHGLSIYKEDDRDEGRRMARAMMERDADVEDGGGADGRKRRRVGDDKDEDGEVGINDDMPPGHVANHAFTDEELD